MGNFEINTFLFDLILDWKNITRIVKSHKIHLIFSNKMVKLSSAKIDNVENGELRKKYNFNLDL